MRVTLSPGRERPIRDGHPWVFSGAIQSEHGDPQAAVAEVFDSAGARLGSGFYSAASQIRVRMLAGDPLRRPSGAAPAAVTAIPGVDAGYFEARLLAADGWRQRLLPAGTTGYRLLNAEGDGLPGWTVDRFGSVLVSQVTSAGLEKLRGPAYEALGKIFPGSPILHLGDLAARREEGLPLVAETILVPCRARRPSRRAVSISSPSSKAGRRPVSIATSGTTAGSSRASPAIAACSTSSPTAARSRSMRCAAAPGP